MVGFAEVTIISRRGTLSDVVPRGPPYVIMLNHVHFMSKLDALALLSDSSYLFPDGFLK